MTKPIETVMGGVTGTVDAGKAFLGNDLLQIGNKQIINELDPKDAYRLRSAGLWMKESQ